jgi:hypothetical protein
MSLGRTTPAKQLRIVWNRKMLSAQRQTLPETAIEFWIGRDAEGFSTARGADGREGGLFVNREEAMKFARAARRRGQGVVKNAPSPVDLGK